jgi:hypothetical protein
MTAEQVRIWQLLSDVSRERDRVRQCEETIAVLRGAQRLMEYHRACVLQCYAIRLVHILHQQSQAVGNVDDMRHELLMEAQMDAAYLVAADVERTTMMEGGV